MKSWVGLVGNIVVFVVARLASADMVISPDTSLAYTWDRGYPQACQCIETGVALRDCSIYKCPCTCDLTAGSCDYNCCCDPDCSQEQIDHFENDNEVCDFSGSAPEVEHLCYSTKELQKVNPRNPVGGSSTSATAVDELLCVSKVNKEYKGDFYDEPVWRDNTIFQTNEGQKSFDYSSSILTVDADAAYDRNDTIPIYFNMTDSILSNGYLTLPKADFSGYCNDNNYAKFQNSVSNQYCKRNLDGELGEDAFSGNCLRDLSTAYYTSLLVAATPTNNLLSLSTVPVTLSSVAYASTSSPLRDITDDWIANDCSTIFGNNESLSKSCQFTSEIIVSSEKYCFNAVKSIAFVISHDQSSSSAIKNVSLHLVVRDIALVSASGEDFDLVQDYSITFMNAPNVASISSLNGNQVFRYRSGNPGYKTGLPLLFGPLMNGVVNMSVQGLGIPTLVSATSSEQESIKCLTGEDHVMTTLNFGQDVLAGCTSSFNRSEFRKFCIDNTRPSFLTTTEGYVGYFGNADPLDISQWFQLSAPPDGATWQWNEATSVCSSMTTGIRYKFLVGYAGEKANPQSKIISATVDYTTQDVRLRIPIDDKESKQKLTFSVSATFIFKDDQELKGYTPPPPPGLLTVPYDVFYPFVGNSAASQSGFSLVQYASLVILLLLELYLLG